MKPSLMLAEPAHLDEILPFIFEFNATEGITTAHDIIHKSLSKLLHDPSLGVVAMIMVNDAIAGYIILTYGYDIEYGGRDAWITDFYLRPGYQGKGIGTWALQEIETLAKANNVCALHLLVYDTNHRAKKVYSKCGFVPHPRTAMMKFLSSS